MRYLRYLLPVTFAFVIAAAANVSSAPRSTTDRCVIDGYSPASALNTFVFQDVAPLTTGRSIALHGIFFTGARRPEPFEGSAMVASDGSVRLGIFVHSSAASTNDFTLSGITDATFAGTLGFDSDGDYRNENTLTLTAVDCATVTIP